MAENSAAELDFDFHGPALDSIFTAVTDLRERCPVGRSQKYGGFWFITKRDDISAALQDHETFSSEPSSVLPVFGTDVPLIPVDIDPPNHTAYRKILQPLFTANAVAQLNESIRSTSRKLATEVAAQKVVDASRTFARPMPTIIFSRLAGFPEKDWPKFDRWVDDIIYNRIDDPERAAATAREVRDYFDTLLRSRAGDERIDDLIGHLLVAQVDGRKLTHEELLSYCYFMLIAGLDATPCAIRSSLWYLAQNPYERTRLRENPDLIPDAAEEFVRTLPPIQGMARTCMKDIEVSGQQIKAGDRVVLVYAAGNRDPEFYENPDDIVLDRQNNRHLGFGAGVHRCVGAILGRRELVVALEEFLDIVPEFSLVDPSEPWHSLGPLTLRIGH